MRLIFADRTAKWVPFATIAVLVIVCWGGMVWELESIEFATIFCFWLALVLLLGVFLQGWLYWTDQVETLSTDGVRYEARLMRWVGWGKRVTFTEADAVEWDYSKKSTDADAVAFINFKVRGRKLSLSMLSPQLADLDALGALAPAFFAQLRADFPTLNSKADGVTAR